MFARIRSFLLRLTIQVSAGWEDMRAAAAECKHKHLLCMILRRTVIGGAIAALAVGALLAGWIWSSEADIREAKERFARIQPGMTRTEVREIMGDRESPGWGQTGTAVEHTHRRIGEVAAEQITYSLSRFGVAVVLEVTLDADGQVRRLYCYE